MEWFFVLVGVAVIVALIRIWNASNDPRDQSKTSSVPIQHWVGIDVGNSDGGDGSDASGAESGGGSFDGGGSNGGGGDSSGF